MRLCRRARSSRASERAQPCGRSRRRKDGNVEGTSESPATSQEPGVRRAGGKKVVYALLKLLGWALIVALVLAALFYGGLLWFFASWERKAHAKVIEGQALVKAIEAYRCAEGVLPGALSDVAPKYAKAETEGWEYRTFTRDDVTRDAGEKTAPDDSFYLTFHDGFYGIEYLSFPGTGWLINYKDGPVEELELDPDLGR